jgi:tetratricopeptide (TPR) repeat protein
MSLLPAALLLAVAAAEDPPPPCPGDCGGSARCLAAEAACLVDGGFPRQAIERLRAALAQAPADGDLALLLAWAYLAEGNRVWATRTLLAWVEAEPADPRARAWAAWVTLQDGDVARARLLLDGAAALPPGPEAARLDLVESALAGVEGRKDEAIEALLAAGRAPRVYPEDRTMIAALRRARLGDRGEPVSARLELSGGVTSNAVESAPQDAGAGAAAARGPAAPVSSIDAVVRWEPWASRALRPLAEGRAKGFAPLSDETEGYGYLSGGLRAGGEIGPADGRRGRLLYAGELLALRGDEDPDEIAAGLPAVDGGLLMEAHRGELEVDLGPHTQVFAGGGRRVYSDMIRTRTEADGGAALVLPLSAGWNLTGVLGGRFQRARHPGWDAWGLTGLVRLRVPLPADWMLLGRTLVLWDVWPRFGLYEPSVNDRRDLSVKVEVGPWTRAFGGWRFGLSYALTRRASALDDYDFTDHRALLEARWQRATNPRLPRAAGAEPPSFPWGAERGADDGLDRVQDLLRQEDSARRGSSCAD